jgi:hypothetical protein
MLNAGEALYGFVMWLAADKCNTHQIGGGHHGVQFYKLLAKYCKENDIPEPPDGWEKHIKLPSYEVPSF